MAARSIGREVNRGTLPTALARDGGPVGDWLLGRPGPFTYRLTGVCMTEAMPMVPLGDSGLLVSRFALGSWRTFERIGHDQGICVMTAARDAGITFLDDARYNDETGRAPIPSGYSEVIFGELFRAAGWRRADTTVANKLWWEFWPDQSAAEELTGSLARMRFDYLDLIYSDKLPQLEPDRRRARLGGRRPSGHTRPGGGATAVQPHRPGRH
jgi:hypothetical protein